MSTLRRFLMTPIRAFACVLGLFGLGLMFAAVFLWGDDWEEDDGP